MNTFNPVFLLATLVVGVLGTIALVRIGRARRRAARRVVERPNSHYVSQLARETEARHRWHDIQLDRLHEINREEVVRLLAKVEVGGVDVLRTNERTFLDYMAELTRKSSAAKPERDEDTLVAPELRHRPA